MSTCNRMIEVLASPVGMSHAQHTHTHALYEYHTCHTGEGGRGVMSNG
jgi:hypothetical protein